MIPIKTICCYCPGWKRDAPENKGASHGICASCLKIHFPEPAAK